jgi:hypothetical protein
MAVQMARMERQLAVHFDKYNEKLAIVPSLLEDALPAKS